MPGCWSWIRISRSCSPRSTRSCAMPGTGGGPHRQANTGHDRADGGGGGGVTAAGSALRRLEGAARPGSKPGSMWDSTTSESEVMPVRRHRRQRRSHQTFSCTRVLATSGRRPRARRLHAAPAPGRPSVRHVRSHSGGISGQGTVRRPRENTCSSSCSDSSRPRVGPVSTKASGLTRPFRPNRGHDDVRGRDRRDQHMDHHPGRQ